MRDPKAAERQRRRRKHMQGNHSDCLVGNCPAVTPVTVTENVTSGLNVAPTSGSLAPSELDARGQKLWDELTASWTPSPLHRELLLEACRMADRLEKLDRQLKGEDWLRFWSRNDDGSEVTVYVDKVLAEARELAAQFRQTAEVLVKAAGAVKPVKGGGKLASITALGAAPATRRGSA
jgi:hypothetical protein